MHPVLDLIQSGQRVFVHGGAATPAVLTRLLLEHAPRLRNVELIHIHTMDQALYADKKYSESFKVANLFVGSNMRDHLRLGEVDYLPCFLSEIPQLFRSGRRAPDVALIHVSPPDRHGYCTLGTSVDVARAAVDSAKVLIAQINDQMPRAHGDGFVHIDDIDAAIEVSESLPEQIPGRLDEAELTIGKNVANLVDDGSTLQVGIGNIPNAVMSYLKNHKNLGLHTEMWSDGALELIKLGVVDNSQKRLHPGKTVSSFVIGSKNVYDFIHDNPSVVQLDVGYVNDPVNIARNPKVAAINSAVEVDLTGQICADSVGSKIISGVGGQVDFLRGAAMSPGGCPIIAMTSRTAKGIPRIVAQLKHGAGVVTSRAHVHYVVTEYGVVNLFGKTLSERAKALISLAHPDDRENLERMSRMGS